MMQKMRFIHSLPWLSLTLLWFSASPVHADASLWKQIQTEPNIVLLLRHGDIQPQAGQTGASFDPSGNCQGEVMLSAKGRSNSVLVGEIFRQQRVTPVVVASAMCRTRDTALLAFGQTQIDPALRESLSGDKQRHQDFLRASTEWIQKYRGARPLALVMHLPNIDSLSAEQPEMGEMVVTRATEQGELDVLGRIVLHKP